ncbi:MAG TPA: hypothetical protein VNB67_09565, partial [Nitrososphaeraceae archaeon]|nr:hypothetical protein [Nitrososphaeraceae archaeon]
LSHHSSLCRLLVLRRLLIELFKSQMDSEIQKSVKSSIKNLSTSLEEESCIQTDWEEKVKDYVDMVLNEKEKTKKV